MWAANRFRTHRYVVLFVVPEQHADEYRSLLTLLQFRGAVIGLERMFTQKDIQLELAEFAMLIPKARDTSTLWDILWKVLIILGTVVVTMAALVLATLYFTWWRKHPPRPL